MNPTTNSELVDIRNRILWLIGFCKANKIVRFDKDFIELCELPNYSYIADLRKGKIENPSFSVIWNIHKNLRVRMDWLAEGIEPIMEPPQEYDYSDQSVEAIKYHLAQIKEEHDNLTLQIEQLLTKLDDLLKPQKDVAEV